MDKDSGIHPRKFFQRDQILFSFTLNLYSVIFSFLFDSDLHSKPLFVHVVSLEPSLLTWLPLSFEFWIWFQVLNIFYFFWKIDRDIDRSRIPDEISLFYCNNIFHRYFCDSCLLWKISKGVTILKCKKPGFTYDVKNVYIIFYISKRVSQKFHV